MSHITPEPIHHTSSSIAAAKSHFTLSLSLIRFSLKDNLLSLPTCTFPSIPSNKIDNVFPSLDVRPAKYLAYVEWFSPTPAAPDPKHLMYKVLRSIQGG